jgi:acyl-CoA thioesterase-1
MQWRYLPLGDSYTICTGASEKESWPYLLTRHLNSEGINCRLLANPARNGFSTQDLIDQELPLVKTLKPDLVTLLIGVNDWAREVPAPVFGKNLDDILDELQKVLIDKHKIILITIPDFGVTPQGKWYGHGRDISHGISEFNGIIRLQARKRQLPMVDIFELSQKMGTDPTLVAADGLHPSAKEYAIWEKKILAEALKLLKQP